MTGNLEMYAGVRIARTLSLWIPEKRHFYAAIKVQDERQQTEGEFA